ncbi:MAG: NADH-quinone oxidoreductase subunit J [Candidatus Gastranaerophilales bacterium]|nr:NADH-quinone oxidoreductase subunit J [Candidatus Gastranaerophilales bacterium]
MINAEAVIFYIFVLFVLGGGFFAIFSEQNKNAVTSAFICFFSVGMLMFSLELPFLAVSQILIAAVGLTFLFLMFLILTENKNKTAEKPSSFVRNVISLAVVFLLVVLIAIFIKYGSFSYEGINLNCVMPSTKDISTEMFINYGIPFLFIGLILTSALIGAGVLMSDIKNGKRGNS